MPPGQGAGVSIGVNANTGQAQRGIAGIGQSITKLAQTSKSLFGGASVQQVQNYNKHLSQLERNLDRITLRVKSLQGAQAQLLSQQKALVAAGASADQLKGGDKALQQTQRSLSFWQAKQMGAQGQVSFAQQNAPTARVGGGGGGMAGFMVGQAQQMAGGMGGAFLKATGLSALVGGVAAIGAKAFMTAFNEQTALADLLPRHQSSAGLRGASGQGLMNEFRKMSTPLGFTGQEGLKIAGAVGPGSGGFAALQRDTQTAMQLARATGVDAGTEGGIIGEAGKMGGFTPGEAKRFGEILAREIGKSNPRALEVQEATLSLMHTQIAGAGTANPAVAAALQMTLAKTGLPGLQGQFGANMISQMQSKFGGAEDDPTIAFTEAMLRDQRGVRGYYKTRRAKERIQFGQDPNFIGDAVKEAYSLSHTEDAAKDLLSQVLGVPLILLDAMGGKTKGGLRGLTTKKFHATLKGLQGGGGRLGEMAAAAMSQTGNQFRFEEATLNRVFATVGTPMVAALGKLMGKGSEVVNKLINIEQSSHNTAEALMKMAGMGPKAIEQNTPGNLKHGVDKHGKAVADPVDKAANALTRPFIGFGHWLTDTGKVAHPHRTPGGPPVLPHVTGPAHPTKRASADGDHLHIHVHYDHTGLMHPQHRLAFQGMVEDAMSDIQHRKTRTDLHHRYPRVG